MESWKVLAVSSSKKRIEKIRVEALMADIYEQIQQWAQEAGASHVRRIDRTQLKTFDYVRAYCVANACGYYGRCWTCPPNLGEPEELTAELQSFAGGAVIQNITKIEDSWDFEGMEAARRAHNQMMRSLARQVTAEHPGHRVLALGGGACGYCETCTCPDAPCRAPEQAIAAVEGYGLDVKLLVESCGLSYVNGQNTVSYVGAVLVD